jgi:hypothetical protein
MKKKIKTEKKVPTTISLHTALHNRIVAERARIKKLLQIDNSINQTIIRLIELGLQQTEKGG